MRSYTLLPILALAAAKNVTIDVGKIGPRVTPDTVSANVGDTIVFQFYDDEHSVVSSTFDTPCVPDNTPPTFYSGYIEGEATNNNTFFTVKVISTDPIWFYCSAHTHCQRGMVGVINPPSNSNQTAAAYADAAVNVTTNVNPAGGPEGGESFNATFASASLSAGTSSSNLSYTTPVVTGTSSSNLSYTTPVVTGTSVVSGSTAVVTSEVTATASPTTGAGTSGTGSTPTPTSTSTSGGYVRVAKIGLGFGVPVLLMLGVLLG